MQAVAIVEVGYVARVDQDLIVAETPDAVVRAPISEVLGRCIDEAIVGSGCAVDPTAPQVVIAPRVLGSPVVGSPLVGRGADGEAAYFFS